MWIVDLGKTFLKMLESIKIRRYLKIPFPILIVIGKLFFLRILKSLKSRGLLKNLKNSDVIQNQGVFEKFVKTQPKALEIPKPGVFETMSKNMDFGIKIFRKVVKTWILAHRLRKIFSKIEGSLKKFVKSMSPKKILVSLIKR